jgi:hypothetical protein
MPGLDIDSETCDGCVNPAHKQAQPIAHPTSVQPPRLKGNPQDPVFSAQTEVSIITFSPVARLTVPVLNKYLNSLQLLVALLCKKTNNAKGQD